MTRDIELALVKDEAIHFSSQFDCSQDALWHAITDSQELSAWLGGPSFIEPRVDGRVQLRLPELQTYATGVVRVCDPPRPGYEVALLEHTFVANGSAVTSICRWVVKSTATGSELVFTHDGAAPAEHGQFATALTHGIVRRRTRLNEARSLLADAHTVLLVSFIGPEVPTTLIQAGFDVVAKTGPGPDEWATCAMDEGTLRFDVRDAPASIDLLHLDVSDAFDEYLEVARQIGARTFWFHSARTEPPAPHDNRGCWLPPAQSDRQRRIVQESGLAYVDDLYIGDVAVDLLRRRAKSR